MAAEEGVSVPNLPPAQCQGAKVQEVGLQHEGPWYCLSAWKGASGQDTEDPAPLCTRWAPGRGQMRQQSQ